jgi:TolB-like protein
MEVGMSVQHFKSKPFIRLIIAVYLLSLAAPAALSQQKKPVVKKQNVAVMDFDARGGISKEDAASLSDAFQAQLVETNEFVVVDRNRIRAILNEQGFQQSEACSQVECLVEAGKILKVEKMFAGTIGKVGKIFTVNIQLIDVATAEIISNKSRQHSGAIEELLTEVVPNIAAEMASALTGKDVEAKETKSSGGGSGWVWWVLGGAAVAGGAAAVVLSSSGSSNGTPATDQSKTQLPDSPAFP